ncbi:hypothetical protein ACHAW6_014089 [Cyclotella cf. meneghiniana]
MNHPPLLAYQRRWKKTREQESVTSTSSHSSGRAESMQPFPSLTFNDEPKDTLVQVVQNAAIILQANVRSFIVKKKYTRIRFQALQQRHLSAVTIQTQTRVALQRHRFEKLRNGIICLQAHVRAANARASYSVIYAATIKIQSSIRAMLLRNAAGQTSNAKDLNALVKLQSRYRCYHKHSQFVKFRRGLVLLQARIRAMHVRLICKNLHHSIILIQSINRGALSRGNTKRLISGVLLLQSKFRGRVQKIAYASILASVIRIQGFVRRLIQRTWYRAIIAGVTRLQSRARGASQRARLLVPVECTGGKSRSASIDVERSTPSVLQIQALVRKKISSERYLRLRRNLITCQACVRGMLLRRLVSKWRSFAVKIQTSVRRYYALNTFKKKKSRAIVIQSWARMTTCRRQYSITMDELHNFTASARTIRRTWYRYKTTNPDRPSLSPEYFACHKTLSETSIAMIQRKWLSSQELKKKEQSVRKLQSLTRKWLGRKEIILASQEKSKKDQSARKLQALIRAWITRRDIKVVNQRVAIIQRCFRRFLNVVGKRCLTDARAVYTPELRLQYEHLTSTLYQAQVLRSGRSELLRAIQSVVNIQRLHRRKHKEALSRLRKESAAKMIQSKVRSWWHQKDLESEKELISAIDFVGKRKPSIHRVVLPDAKQNLLAEPGTGQVTLLSSPVRKLQEEHYKKVSARTIQKVARGLLCRSRRSLINASALKIQQWYQHHSVHSSRNATSYENMHFLSCNIIQRRKNKVEEMCHSVITIQKALRLWIHRRSYASCVTEDPKSSDLSSLIAIQAVARGYLMRSKFLRYCQFARVIQKRWKARKFGVYSKDYEGYCRRIIFMQTKRHYKIYHFSYILQSPSSSKEIFDQHQQQYFEYSHYGDKEFLLRAVESLWRGALVRKQLQRKRPFIRHPETLKLSSSIAIQAIARMSLIKMKYFRLRMSALVIQRFWKKSHYAIDTSARIYEKYYKRIILLQRNSRHNACSASMIKIEKESIGLSSYRETVEHHGKTDVLASAVQSIWRGVLVRNHLQRTSDAAVTIQQFWAKYRSFKNTSSPVDRDNVKICEKKMKLQAIYREKAPSLRSSSSSSFHLCPQTSNWLVKSNGVQSLDVKSSMNVVQAVWRDRQIRRQLNMWTAAANVVQKQWKMYRKARGTRKVSPPQCDTANNLGSLWVVCLFQAKLRGSCARKQLITTNHAALTIQKCWLQYIKSKAGNQHQLYSTCVAQSLCVQTFFRKVLAKYTLSTVEAVVTVQSFYRAQKAKSTYSLMVWSAKRLQAFIRMSFSKHSFRLMMRQKHSAILLQSLFRAVVVRLEVRKQIAAAKTIQIKFRAIRIRHQYGPCIQLVVLLQSFARMVLARNAFNDRLHSCLLIQNLSRGFLTRLRLSKLSSKAAIIQNTWFCYRVQCKSQNQKKSYSRFCSSIAIIQKLIRRRFDYRHEAAKKIQVLYFSWRMQISLARVLSSVVQVQRIARGHLSRHNTSCLSRQESSGAKRHTNGLNGSDEEMHDSTLILQRFFRGCIGGSISTDYATLSRAETNVEGMSSDDDDSDIVEHVSGDSTPNDGSIESDSSDGCLTDKIASHDSRPGTANEDMRNSALILQRFFRHHLYRFTDIEPMALKMESNIESRMSNDGDYSGISDPCSTESKMNDRSIKPELTRTECNKGATHRSSIEYASSVEHQTQAVILLQGIAREFLCERKAHRFNIASACIQRAWSDYKFTNKTDCNHHDRLKHLRDVTIVIQTKWRQHARAKVALKQIFAAIKLQSVLRSWLCQNTLISSRRSAVLIQQCFRSHLEKQSVKRVMGATLLQSMVRTWRCQQELSSLSKNALKIQKCGREFLRVSRKKALRSKLEYEKDLRVRQETDATILVQSAMRSWICQRRLAKSISAVVLIQRKIRRVHETCESLDRLYLAISLLRKERAAVKIQSFLRMGLSRRHLTCMKNALIPVFTQSKAIFTPKIVPNKNSAAAKIQSVYRQYLSTRDETQHRIALEEASIKIQLLYRRYYVQSHLLKRQYAIKIQSLARMHFVSARLSRMRTACTQIQASFRRYQGQLQLRKKIFAARRLQCLFRMNEAKSLRFYLEAKTFESNKADVVQTNSAVVLQRIVRGYLIRQRLSFAHEAATVIQRTQRDCVIRLQKKLLEVFHVRSSLIEQCSVAHTSILKRSSSALLPKDKQKLNRIRDIAPHLPRDHGVFIELILNSVAVNIQSFARRHLAIKRFNVQLAALMYIQRYWRRMSPRKNRVTSAAVVTQDKLDSETKSNPENDESKTDVMATKETYAEFKTSTKVRSGYLSLNATNTEYAEDHTNNSFKQSIAKDISLDSRVILIQSLFRGSHVRKERSICNSSAAILQGFLRRRCKSKSKRRGSNLENCSVSIGSSGSRSSLRLSTEDENHALLNEIYQKAEASAVAHSRSVCVSQYAWRLLLATEQELMLDG